ncbi:MAG: T9SS type A sorting domain-containing protein [Flavobacteriaceae bacterium]|nr:T9SS type A sorting domain-containing protein [Flavobacteriaceae bacterium]MDG2314677.1 T9SS type A sorting domain-containing protein [Flavobacteriaceae bacterium]
MKHFYFLLFFIPFFAFSQTLVNESFTYSDGTALNSTTNWALFSGNTPGQIIVNSGQIVIKDSMTEDIEAAFSTSDITGNIYASFDFSVADPTSYTGTDFEYFFLFKPTSSTSYRAKVDIAAFSASGFKPGVASSSSTAEVIWAQDLSYATTYRMTVKYNTVTGQSQMWIDAATEADTSITTTIASTIANIDAVAFRQAGASPDQTITIDNLKVATSFANTLSTDVSNADSFSLYPNPTSTDIVYIAGMEGSKKAVLHDLMGRVVLKAKIKNQLNIAGVKKGVYLLELTVGDRKSTKKLIVK